MDVDERLLEVTRREVEVLRSEQFCLQLRSVLDEHEMHIDRREARLNEFEAHLSEYAAHLNAQASDDIRQPLGSPATAGEVAVPALQPLAVPALQPPTVPILQPLLRGLVPRPPIHPPLGLAPKSQPPPKTGGAAAPRPLPKQAAPSKPHLPLLQAHIRATLVPQQTGIAGGRRSRSPSRQPMPLSALFTCDCSAPGCDSSALSWKP